MLPAAAMLPSHSSTHLPTPHPDPPRPTVSREGEDEGPLIPDGFDPKVVEVYQGVGKVLSRYTAGKVGWQVGVLVPCACLAACRRASHACTACMPTLAPAPGPPG